jgi:hypothetical protein
MGVIRLLSSVVLVSAAASAVAAPLSTTRPTGAPATRVSDAPASRPATSPSNLAADPLSDAVRTAIDQLQRIDAEAEPAALTTVQSNAWRADREKRRAAVIPALAGNVFEIELTVFDVVPVLGSGRGPRAVDVGLQGVPLGRTLAKTALVALITTQAPPTAVTAYKATIAPQVAAFDKEIARLQQQLTATKSAAERKQIMSNIAANQRLKGELIVANTKKAAEMRLKITVVLVDEYDRHAQAKKGDLIRTRATITWASLSTTSAAVLLRT